jgi:hypothetical protein
MVTMAPFVKVGKAARISALCDVGQALGLAPNLIPDRNAASSDLHHLITINKYRVAMALQPLPSLDYTGFVAALNALAALTGPTLRPTILTLPKASSNATPPITGSILSTTTGTWANTPTSYTYQWQRNGVNYGGTAANYTLLAADVGHGYFFVCLVTAVNAGGNSTPAYSSFVVVP